MERKVAAVSHSSLLRRVAARVRARVPRRSGSAVGSASADNFAAEYPPSAANCRSGPGRAQVKFADTRTARIVVAAGAIAVCGVFSTSSALAAAPDAVGITLAQAQPKKAQLNARINPGGSAITGCEFQWGSTDSYSNSAPCLTNTASETTLIGDATSTLVPVAAILEDLEPDTTYHYRLTLSNGDGSFGSGERTFTTPSTIHTCGAGDCIGIDGERTSELVSTVDSPNSSGVGAAYLDSTGEGVLYQPANAAQAALDPFNPFRAKRTESGWHSESIIPPTFLADNDLPPSQNVGIAQLSPDLSRALGVDGPGTFSPEPAWPVWRFAENAGVPVAEPVFRFPESEEERLIASEDLERVIQSVQNPVDPDHAPGTSHLYEIDGGSATLVDRLPDGSVPVCGIESAGMQGFVSSIFFDSLDQNWLSADGRYLFFQAVPGAACSDPKHLYRRDLETGATELVSGPTTGGTDTGLANAGFVQAARDASWVIYKARAQLDSDDADTTPDIYRHDFATGANTCLTCVASIAANVQQGTEHAVASDDGTHVYFRSQAQLTPDAPSTTSKLYLWRAAGGPDGSIEFVRRSSQGIRASRHSTEMSADGDVLVFLANNATTADDHAGEQQLYRYDASARSLVCVSCPIGQPAGATAEPLSPSYQYQRGHALTRDGSTLVFVTDAQLAPGDIDTADDVYEYEDGVAALITDGQRAGLKTIAFGLSDDGRGILFTGEGGWSPDPAAVDAQELYVARRGGGFPVAPTPPQTGCSGDSCQGPQTSAPEGPNVGSATVPSTGNVVETEEPDCKRFLVKAKRKLRKAKKVTAKAKRKLRKAKKVNRRRAKRLNRQAKRLIRKAKRCEERR